MNLQEIEKYWQSSLKEWDNPTDTKEGFILAGQCNLLNEQFISLLAPGDFDYGEEDLEYLLESDEYWADIEKLMIEKGIRKESLLTLSYENGWVGDGYFFFEMYIFPSGNIYIKKTGEEEGAPDELVGCISPYNSFLLSKWVTKYITRYGDMGMPTSITNHQPELLSKDFLKPLTAYIDAYDMITFLTDYEDLENDENFIGIQRTFKLTREVTKDQWKYLCDLYISKVYSI